MGATVEKKSIDRSVRAARPPATWPQVLITTLHLTACQGRRRLPAPAPLAGLAVGR